jgi:putative transposase
MRALEEENEWLKCIIARQAFEIEVKSELFKKNSHPNQTKKMIVEQYKKIFPTRCIR